MEPITHTPCPSCGEVFELATLGAHADVEPIGMQIEDTDHRYNYYYFNHVCANCGSTFLVPVMHFLPLITEPIPELVLVGTEACEQHCVDLKDLRACGQQCRYAPFRRQLIRMIDEKKNRKAAA